MCCKLKTSKTLLGSPLKCCQPLSSLIRNLDTICDFSHLPSQTLTISQTSRAPTHTSLFQSLLLIVSTVVLLQAPLACHLASWEFCQYPGGAHLLLPVYSHTAGRVAFLEPQSCHVSPLILTQRLRHSAEAPSWSFPCSPLGSHLSPPPLPFTCSRCFSNCSGSAVLSLTSWFWHMLFLLHIFSSLPCPAPECTSSTG